MGKMARASGGGRKSQGAGDSRVSGKHRQDRDRCSGPPWPQPCDITNGQLLNKAALFAFESAKRDDPAASVKKACLGEDSSHRLALEACPLRRVSSHDTVMAALLELPSPREVELETLLRQREKQLTELTVSILSASLT
jgi:hypothetical protein